MVPIVAWGSLYSNAAVKRLNIPRSVWQSDMKACASDAARAAKGLIAAGCNFGDGTFKTPECVAQQAKGNTCATMLAASAEWDAGLLQEVGSNLGVPVEVVWVGLANIEKIVLGRIARHEAVLFYYFTPTAFTVAQRHHIARFSLPECGAAPRPWRFSLGEQPPTQKLL